MLQSSLRSHVQAVGTTISRTLFTKRILNHRLGKQSYLLLYRAFKQIFESQELQNLKTHIHEGGVVLDIGANVGVTAAFFSHVVGPRGHVLAFEPDPIVGDLFQYHMHQRNIQNVRLFPVALGAQDTSATFFQNASNRADNRMVLDAETMTHTETVSVHVRSISSLAQEFPDLFKHVEFIKMDVQGYESRVIAGMADWMQTLEQKPVIHMEVWPYGLKKAGSSPEELFALCTQLGYVMDTTTQEQVKRMSEAHEYVDITLLPNRSRA